MTTTEKAKQPRRSRFEWRPDDVVIGDRERPRTAETDPMPPDKPGTPPR